MAMQLYGLDPSVAKAYQPQLKLLEQQIGIQKETAKQNLFTNLANRGLLQSGALESGLLGIEKQAQNIYNQYATNILSQAYATDLQLREQKRQEEELKNWGLLTTALTFLSPLISSPISALGEVISTNILKSYGISPAVKNAVEQGVANTITKGG